MTDGPYILYENMCSSRNEKPGDFNQDLMGMKCPTWSFLLAVAQSHVDHPAANLEPRRGGLACHHLALALALCLLNAGNPQ